MPGKTKKADRVRAAVVGLGMGSGHARGYHKCAGSELVAICDIDTERARRVADEYGVKRIYTDYQTMFTEEKLDAVSVATPNSLHAPVAIAALQAGINVLCEKPLSTSAVEGQKIADAARKSKGLFMMGMNNRFRDDTRILRATIERGELGEIYYARCGWVRRSGIPGAGTWFTRKEMSGGGPLIDLGVHALDLTLYLMGNPRPVSVFGATYGKFGPAGRAPGMPPRTDRTTVYDVEDLAAAQIRLENGATVVLEASWAQYCERERLYSEVYGDRGGATIDPLRIFTDHAGTAVDIAPAVQPVNGHEAEVAYFVDCIANGRKPHATIEQALDVMKVLDGIYKSSQTGASVAL